MKWRIPLSDIDFGPEEAAAVADVVHSKWLTMGTVTQEFERAFADYVGAKYAIAVANGTVALHLALSVLDIGPGDEVIIPDLTFVATANAVSYTGATPLIVDVDPIYWTINPKTVEANITSRTKAIIPVHLYGHPADMDPIMDIADQYGLYVIEDAAEAHGAEYKGRLVGGLGHIGVFSFYGNKIITTGEGGMLTSNNLELMEKARFLKDHGMSTEKRYYHPVVGFNYRMTNIQAAIGLAQLERIEQIIQRKLNIARLYHDLLEECSGICRQTCAEWAKSIYWMYSILVTERDFLTRDGVMLALRQREIDSRPFFVPMHELPPYRKDGDYFSVATDISRRGINLPSFPSMTDQNIEYISKALCSLMKKNNSFG